ncbi:phosphate ABC transporter ATP-binding protein [Cerasibacillus terrae]|uniref:Phosphate ABC transporter ATP-binding protein n=1 Tax=Cerasibacillus terrae TaxID=2498845 RepID=A0A5C8NWW9_9BACI|nr:phosphate ABC transporter ATP-binding protein [Cerasibacillus terrae]TXL65702.1 phosphate ABC transporter ATP-binding protein [Cerasibacillus terrae]
MTETNQAIQLNQVNYSITGELILKNITHSFPTGKITTLVGPSGAGKTTLFRLCNGLISRDSGEIFINGKSIDDYDPLVLRQTVGIALQSATMISGSIFDNLALPLTLKGEQLSEEDANKLLELVGLEKSLLYRNSKDLSGGQLQKVSIARTLVNEPSILLLDEITSSLDRVSQQDIEKLIKRINENYGTTIIWITHNLKQAYTIGDYTVVMMDGEVIESGPSDLLHNPKTNRTKKFVRGEIE